MKTPKFIQKLAFDIATKEAKEYDFIAKDVQCFADDYVKELMNVRNALLQGRYYTGVDKVSSSGMSRTITIRYIKDNELRGVSDFIYAIAGCNKKRSISGGGMDMLFAAQYNLFMKLCPNHIYQKDMPRYNDL